MSTEASGLMGVDRQREDGRGPEGAQSITFATRG
jgi:hypothetical protein